MFKLDFQGYKCEVIKNSFENNNSICLNLIAREHCFGDNQAIKGEPIARVSVNVAGLELEENQTVIKNYSENKGILDALVDEGYVEVVADVNKEHPNSFVLVNVLI